MIITRKALVILLHPKEAEQNSNTIEDTSQEILIGVNLASLADRAIPIQALNLITETAEVEAVITRVIT